MGGSVDRRRRRRGYDHRPLTTARDETLLDGVHCSAFSRTVPKGLDLAEPVLLVRVGGVDHHVLGDTSVGTLIRDVRALRPGVPRHGAAKERHECPI